MEALIPAAAGTARRKGASTLALGSCRCCCSRKQASSALGMLFPLAKFTGFEVFFMAKYVPSALIGQLSGSEGSNTFSHNRNGAYMRNRTIPVNPNSGRQGIVRNFVTSLSQFWRSLTDAQRNDWRTLGAQMQRVDSLGQPYNLTGLQAYVAVNVARLNGGVARQDNAPLLGVVWNPGTLTIDWTTGVGAHSNVAFTGTPGLTDVLVIFATADVSQGRNFFGKGDYVWMKQVVNPTSPVDIETEWLARFGAKEIGAKVSVQIYPMNSDYVPGQKQTASDIIS